jgi:GT2 family glycosyltransferase
MFVTSGTEHGENPAHCRIRCSGFILCIDHRRVDISAVIPTRNRMVSLRRLLRSLSGQTYPLKEVVIVDSSDEPLEPHSLQTSFPRLKIIYRPSEPAACVQRNEGIRLATASHVFICPDDLEVPEGYLQSLVFFIEQHPDAGAVSGLLREPDGAGEFRHGFPTVRLRALVWKFLFQQTVWADLSNVEVTALGKPVLHLLRRYYRRRGNTYTLAGWPLVTQIGGPYFRTSLFSLGGAVIRRDWLLQSPYDEILDQHGIGDNYGVALHFPMEQPIWVTTETSVVHHKVSENRLPRSLTYFRRILALHYFMKNHPRFTPLNRMWLLWSLVGNALYFMLRQDAERRRATLKAMQLILTGRNPYVHARRNGAARRISPVV